MPNAEPGTRTIAFPAVWDGVQVQATAIARGDQIDIIPVPGKVLEIPLETWMSMAPWLTAAALAGREVP